MKSIGISYLSKSTLANLNAGQGTGNLTEIKLYDGDRKPYVSGQSLRRAWFDTIERTHVEHFLCVPESPCGDIERCWSCDLRGFLATEEGKSGTRRWSPVKVSPALGQLSTQIVNDMLTRHSVLKKEDSEKETTDNRIAYVQMMENIYLVGIAIDTDNIGYARKAKVEKKGKKETFVGWEDAVRLSENAKLERTRAVLEGLYNLSGFAKQARSVASLAPDIILFTVRDTYNQRGLNLLELSEDKMVNIERIEQYIRDEQTFDSHLIFGYTPGIIGNEQECLDTFRRFGIEPYSVAEAFKTVTKFYC